MTLRYISTSHINGSCTVHAFLQVSNWDLCNPISFGTQHQCWKKKRKSKNKSHKQSGKFTILILLPEDDDDGDDGSASPPFWL